MNEKIIFRSSTDPGLDFPRVFYNNYADPALKLF